MENIIYPLLIVSIIFLFLLIFVFIINSITYAEVYKKAIDPKNKTWGMVMFIISIIGIAILGICIGTIILVIIYYEPNEDFKKIIDKK